MTDGIQIPDFMYHKKNYNEVKANNDKIKQAEQLREAKEQKAKKIEVRKKVIKAALIAIAASTITSAGIHAKEQIVGSNQIKKEFKECVSEYGIIDSSTGYVITKDSQYLEFDNAMNEMIATARYNGMNDTKIYISVSSMFDSKTAKEFVGEKSSQEIENEKSKAYHEHKLSEIEIKSKGVR